ncbi:hypothetical protein O4H61_05195 [Roseovarius aestuarii]|nr:hypothetical protein [Roseovarius aestuarii]
MAGTKTSAGRHGLATKGSDGAKTQSEAKAKAVKDTPPPPMMAKNADRPVHDATAEATQQKSAPQPKEEPKDVEQASNTSTSEPTPAPNSSQPAPSEAEPQGGGTFPLVIGGVVAAAIGFGAAYWILPQLGILMHPQNVSALEARVTAGETDVKALSERLDALPVTDTAMLETRIEQLESDLAGQALISEQMSAVLARLDEVESRPAGSGESVSGGEIAALQDALATQADQIKVLNSKLNADETARAEAAQAAAMATLRRAAVTRIRTALDTGAPFGPALVDLEKTGLVAPDALIGATEGVPTLAALQDTFAPAARAALAAARASGEKDDEAGSSFWSFVGDQLGARSLEPREGPGTDATLSRAEAALRDARLVDALTELETLSDPARAQMTDWADTARSRLEATQALDALSAELN